MILIGRPGPHSAAGRAVRRRAAAGLLAAALAAASVVLFAGCVALDPDDADAGVSPDGWADGAPPPEGEAAEVVAFYGDSYTRGTGTSDLSRRWSTLISRERGWAEFNPSVDGLGFVNNRDVVAGDDLVERIVALEPSPDVVIVTMGLNDNFSMPDRADDIRAAIDADLGRLRDELPDARLVVVEPFWYTDDRPASVDRIIGWVEDAAAEVGADHVPGASRWIEAHPDWMADDGIHPNDDGHAEMARRMDEELDELGL